MTPKMDAHSPAGVLVIRSLTKPGGMIYIVIDNREAFDLIDLPMVDHGAKPTGHVLSKTIDGPNYLIFQHWIKSEASR